MSQAPPKESLCYLRHPALPGIELLVANPSLHGWRMFHERYLLCGCKSVSTSWVYRRKLRHIEDGTTGLMEPGEVHKVVAKKKPSCFVTLFIEPEILQGFAREEGIAEVPHFAAAESADLHLVRLLYEFSTSMKDAADGLKLQSQSAMLLHATLRLVEARPKPSRARGRDLVRSLETAREILHERHNENVGLDELAAAAALSRFHLVRSFAERYGLPPHAYQVQVRIKHARRLLRAGASCAETASATGFADQSHLVRHFKKIMGVTPRQYAPAHRQLGRRI